VEEPAQKRVLVIDDDPTVRAIVAETLRGEGYSVEEAADGGVGLEAVGADKPDLVLLDIRMAGMDGMQFLDELHRASSSTEVPIIIITGTPELPESAHEHGIKAVLTKPFDVGLLTAMVERLVRTGGRSDHGD
jgi:CheY-like chemotaxis protein